MRQRILGYDVAKGIAMFLVVLLHYSFYTRFYSGDVVGSAVTSVCVICVPLFFAVNGALLLPRPLDVRKHYKRLITIVIIVAAWKSLSALFFCLCGWNAYSRCQGFSEISARWLFRGISIRIFLVYECINCCVFGLPGNQNAI